MPRPKPPTKAEERIAVNVRITRARKAAIRRQATRENRTFTNMLEVFIDEGMDKRVKSKPKSEAPTNVLS